MSKNFYDVLGIHCSATADEIKRAYHKIARMHHPDRSKNGDIDLFKQATLAYETLRDKELRQNYDQQFATPDVYTQMKAGFAQAPNHSSFFAGQRFYQRRPHSTHFSSATHTYEERTYASFTQPQSYVRRTQSAKEAAARAAFAKHGQREFADPYFKLRRSGKSRNPYRTSSIRTDWRDSEASDDSESDEDARESSREPSREPPREAPRDTSRDPPLVKDPEIVDLTEEDTEETEKHGEEASAAAAAAAAAAESAEPASAEPASAASPSSSRKRAPENDAGEPSPKRARFFDFSEFKKVPPFTEKHGSSFTFPDFNDLLREDVPTERAQTRSEINHRAQMLLTKYTTEGNAVFEELFQLQNQRVQLIQLPGAPVHLMKQNLVATEKLLAVLLGGTRTVLHEA